MADTELQQATGLVTVFELLQDRQGGLKSGSVDSVRHAESCAKFVECFVGREIGGRINILVMNRAALHIYEIRGEEPNEVKEDLFGERDEDKESYRKETVRVDGFDRVHKHPGIRQCFDLSATPNCGERVGRNAKSHFGGAYKSTIGM